MQRPTAVTVFGILHLVFGALGVCGVVGNAITLVGVFSGDAAFQSPLLGHPVGKFQTVVSAVLSLPITAALIAAGVGLLMMKSWARVLSVIYGAFGVVSTVVGLTLIAYLGFEVLGNNPQAMPPEVVLAVVIGFCSGIIGLVYPALVWFYMTRPWIVAAFDAQQPTADWTYAPPASSSLAAPLALASDNPFAAPQAATGPAVSPLAVGRSATIVDRLIPARNGPALASYYLGLFSLFPFFGLPLGIAALVLGVKGLARARENPEVRGRVHAWVGVVCGSIFGLFNLLLVGAAAIGIGMALVGP